MRTGARGSAEQTRPTFVRVLPVVLAGALVGWLSGPGPGELAAQEDFRGLDVGRPLRTGDAYPKKYLEWEVQLGSSSGWSGGDAHLALPLAVETGLLPDLQIGIEVEPVFVDEEGRDGSWGVEGLAVHALYNLNQESRRVPALAFQAGVDAPVGGRLSREEWALSGRLVATRSFANRTRLHLNAGGSLEGIEDGGDYWTGGLAFDVPLGLSSRLVGADAFVEVPVSGGPTRTWLEVGSRLQLSNWTVLDLGLATRLDRWRNDESNVELVLGFSRVFGVGALTPSPAYPNPAIR